MHNVLDYNEPYIRAPPPSPPSPPSPPRAVVVDDNKGDDGMTVAEFAAALIQIQRAAATAQEKARREAVLRQRLAQQEAAKREAVQLLYLQFLSQAIKEAAEEEERQQREAALAKLFGWR
jgi:hypothetical protein